MNKPVFPKPCHKCESNPGWVVNPENEHSVIRCDCELAIKSREYKKHKNDYRAPVITTEHATICAEMMATIPFFPGEAGARIAIADEIAALCSDPAEAVWIARRMIRLYSKWPGLQELRRVFVASRDPQDGIEALGWSDEYPHGFPKELPRVEAPLIESSTKRQIAQ